MNELVKTPQKATWLTSGTRQLWQRVEKINKAVFTEHGASFAPIGYKLNLSNEEYGEFKAALQPIGYEDALGLLMRLAVHKRIDGGSSRMNVVLQDIADEISEAKRCAVEKAINDFKLADSPFFPNISEFRRVVEKLDNIQINCKVHRGQEGQQPFDFDKHQTFQTKRNVSRIMKIYKKQPAKWSKWEVKFMAAMKEKGTT